MDGVANSQDQDVARKLKALRDAVELSFDETGEAEAGLDPVLPPANLDRLSEKWQVRERPFSSGVPVIGPLIVWIRQTWNDMSTTWYVRSLLQQQNEFNHLVVQQLRSVDMLDAEFDARLTDADRDGTMLARQVAELTYAVTRMEHQLARIERHLDGSASEPS